jgi:hypothetical protein
MGRPSLEIAGIFRDHGAAWREANRGHVSLGQLKVMSAIEGCRTAARREPTHSEIVQALNEMSGRFAESFRGDSRRGGGRRGGYPSCAAVLTQSGRRAEQDNTAA